MLFVYLTHCQLVTLWASENNARSFADNASSIYASACSEAAVDEPSFSMSRGSMKVYAPSPHVECRIVASVVKLQSAMQCDLLDKCFGEEEGSARFLKFSGFYGSFRIFDSSTLEFQVQSLRLSFIYSLYCS